MRPKSITQSASGASSPIPVDHKARPFQLTIGCELVSAGTLTYKVQYTLDDIYAPGYDASSGNWLDHPTLVSKTTSDASNIAFPVRAVRLNIPAYTSGTVRMTVLHT